MKLSIIKQPPLHYSSLTYNDQVLYMLHMEIDSVCVCVCVCVCVDKVL